MVEGGESFQDTDFDGFDWVRISYLVLRIAYRAGGLALIGFELGLFLLA